MKMNPHVDITGYNTVEKMLFALTKVPMRMRVTYSAKALQETEFSKEIKIQAVAKRERQMISRYGIYKKGQDNNPCFSD